MRPPVENGTRSERGLLVCYPDTAAVDWITIDYLPSTLPLPRTHCGFLVSFYLQLTKEREEL